MSLAGKYLITKLFDEFALRYCEAIANTMYRSRTDSKPWSKGTDMVSPIENSTGVLKLIVSAAESELKRISGQNTLNEKVKLENFNKKFLAPDVVGNNFLLKITEGCHQMAQHIETVLFRRGQNYEDQIRLKTTIAEIKTLVEKAKNIYKPSLCDIVAKM